MKRVLFLFTLVISCYTFGQNVSGNWQGIMSHPADTAGFQDNYAFYLKIEQEGDTITGQSRVELGTTKNFAVLNFKGKFKNNHLDIREISWENSHMDEGVYINWCQKRLSLIYTWEDSTESLRGVWTSLHEDCGSGEIYVHRSSKEFNSRTAHTHDYITFADFKKRLRNEESVLNLKVILPEVTFDPYDTKLLKEARNVLRELKELLVEYPNLKINILGHTGNLGSDQYNLTLSHTRAKTVKDYLAKMGISESRLQFHGYGESRPVATNATEEGRRQNRRIEFEVFGE
ncbi:MAG: OmpA family protein [Crocinitomicaceae bacterium]|nr:OmpA family protein [Crocinitomicaceae bacterium]